MELAGIEIAFWPFRHAVQCLRDRDARLVCVGGLWKAVRRSEIGPQAHDKDAAPLLGHTIVCGIEYLGLYVIARFTEDLDLVGEQVAEVPPHHAGHVLDDERFGLDLPQRTSEFDVQRVDPAPGVAHAALAEALAGIAAHQQLGGWESLDFGDIAQHVVRGRMVGQVHVARISQLVVGHHHVKACGDDSSIRATAAREK